MGMKSVFKKVVLLGLAVGVTSCSGSRAFSKAIERVNNNPELNGSAINADNARKQDSLNAALARIDKEMDAARKQDSIETSKISRKVQKLEQQARPFQKPHDAMHQAKEVKPADKNGIKIRK